MSINSKHLCHTDKAKMILLLPLLLTSQCFLGFFVRNSPMVEGSAKTYGFLLHYDTGCYVCEFGGLSRVESVNA